MIGKYIEVYYPEVEMVEYSSSKKYSSNFWARILASIQVLAAAFFTVGQNWKLMKERHKTEIDYSAKIQKNS